MTLYVRIGIAAKKLGVCTKTIRRWEKAEKIQCSRTVGGHRRIAMVEIKRLYGKLEEQHHGAQHQTAIYARVSSHEQKIKGDLARQVQAAQEWCEQQETTITPVVFTDVGSGLNTTRRGLQQLCKAIEAGHIERVIVTYPDRLTRFGFHYLATYFQSHGVTIRCIQQTPEQSLQAELG